ncbi:DUF3352 domain-containing protein [[Phormidium] sp. ETS-05]|uniref:DUF3352 domain-containing protein n=1 Tax=[Phormidium] sp. ETS-05 TaxID=222819 RepID=UPI0018EEEFC8|nr:DUF3352 domain-containing protein [[Phormidium] sp. ETS-05]
MLKGVTLPLLSVFLLEANCALAQVASPNPTTLPTPAVSAAMPSNVAGLLLINTQMEAWQSAGRFFPLPPDFQPPGFLPFMPSEVDFSSYIRPWLGDWMAVAMMPETAKPLMVTPVTSEGLLPAFVAEVEKARGKPPQIREYNGARIWVWPEEVRNRDALPPMLPPPSQFPQLKFLPKGLGLLAQQESLPPDWPPPPPPNVELPPLVIPGLAIASMPGFLAASTSAAPIEEWLDSASGQKLAAEPLFQRTVNNPEFAKSLLVGYGNISQLAQSLAKVEALTNPSVPLPLPNPQAILNGLAALAQQADSAEFFLWFPSDGLRVQSRINYSSPRPESALTSSPNTIVSQIPGATYLSFNGFNLSRDWQLFRANASGQSLLQGLLLPLERFARESLQLDIDRDIIPWMDGEYAVFMFPTAQGFLPALEPRLQLGFGIILETSDRPAAERFFARLDEYITQVSNGEVNLNRQEIAGQPITSWEALNPQLGEVQSLLAYGWANEKLLVITTGMGPMTELSPQPPVNLARAYNFQTATAPLPSPNSGYFYLNMGSFLSLIYNFLPPGIGDDPQAHSFKQVLGTIRSISATNSSTDSQDRVDFFFVLSPRPQP